MRPKALETWDHEETRNPGRRTRILGQRAKRKKARLISKNSRRRNRR